MRYLIRKENNIFSIQKSLAVDKFIVGNPYRFILLPISVWTMEPVPLSISSYTHRGLGAVYYDMERFEEGNKHYKLANLHIGYFFNLFYDAKKNLLNEKAVEILKLILEIDQNNRNAYAMLQRELN